MKHSKKAEGMTLYWLTCDQCGDFTEQYSNEKEMRKEAEKDGWIVSDDEAMDFCGPYCLCEYFATTKIKRRTK